MLYEGELRGTNQRRFINFPKLIQFSIRRWKNPIQNLSQEDTKTDRKGKKIEYRLPRFLCWFMNRD